MMGSIDFIISIELVTLDAQFDKSTVTRLSRFRNIDFYKLFLKGLILPIH